MFCLGLYGLIERGKGEEGAIERSMVWIVDIVDLNACISTVVACLKENKAQFRARQKRFAER